MNKLRHDNDELDPRTRRHNPYRRLQGSFCRHGWETSGLATTAEGVVALPGDSAPRSHICIKAHRHAGDHMCLCGKTLPR